MWYGWLVVHIHTLVVGRPCPHAHIDCSIVDYYYPVTFCLHGHPCLLTMADWGTHSYLKHVSVQLQMVPTYKAKASNLSRQMQLLAKRVKRLQVSMSGHCAGK